ncbi:MAG: dTDP-4-dehydrorhamnose reductase [Modestobacter sp.]|jgi:dTDP-4-dehydrorhamnose reductase|nr:dTDP-4-dehydrorhamnose reductase [Modestobacter sp.]
MRVTVLGADGMLGHVVVRTLRAQGDEVTAVTRRLPVGATAEALAGGPVISGVDGRLEHSIASALTTSRPEAVVNCVGAVKQRAEGREAVEAILVNSLLPHRLASLCALAGARMVTISTDCVFSGRTGAYGEGDTPDPVDVYGRSKLLGEVDAEHVVTLRTSMVGLELDRASGLIEWFLRQSGTVRGWDKALYSGLTTAELARVIALLLHDHQSLTGLWHVAGPVIDKLSLLRSFATSLERDVLVVPQSDVVINRTLDGRRFAGITGHRSPSWPDMLDELAGEVRARAR